MERYLCIHGHFYQPPRENPWLEAVELQDSAHPYHDWNDRVTAECYAPNASARILNQDGRIERIVNNFSRISFNVGPTLLAWMKEKLPEVHDAILEADKQSRRRFGGHGSALAQCYNHLIMPLAHPRDKYTQVHWGIQDFVHRFGRKPEGMWLPETAADDASLDALAEQGIQFTILSPFQAHRVRPLDHKNWQDVNGGRVDPSMPYVVRLPSGRSITVFFYDAPVSKAVAFEHLLNDGRNFARRLLDGFDENRAGDQLVHIATDGESYGHHHRHGEMALAYALRDIESNRLARLTNYGQFLAGHPPQWEAQIHQQSAWSCSHGVERWNSHCGCNSGQHPGWNQHWRFPLRQAMDWLRDHLAPHFEAKAREYLQDPWKARNDYISVILDRSIESIHRFFERNAARPLDENDQVAALRLLEMQRHAMLMYTSCGWFFDELSGIETVQIIQYAARAIQLAHDLLGEDLEPKFLDLLERARSNIREFRHGRRIYERFVKPAIVNRETVGAHYAVSSLFESYPEEARIYSFTVSQEDRQLLSAGNARLALGRIRVTFEITRNSDTINYGVLHLGDHNLNCGVRLDQGPEPYAVMVQELKDAFGLADFPQIIRLMDRHFGEAYYSLKSLFRDEQRKILDQVLDSTLAELERSFRSLIDRYSPLMRFLTGLSSPPPEGLRHATHLVLNADLRRQFEQETPDLERVRQLLEECEAIQVPLDTEILAYALKLTMDRVMARCAANPDDMACLEQATGLARLAGELPFEINLWKTQNLYYRLLKSLLPQARLRARKGDAQAANWITQFAGLGNELGFVIRGRRAES